MKATQKKIRENPSHPFKSVFHRRSRRGPEDTLSIIDFWLTIPETRASQTPAPSPHQKTEIAGSVQYSF